MGREGTGNRAAALLERLSHIITASTGIPTEPARALGVNATTVRRYLDLLTDALMVQAAQPWHANLGKRQVKSPKIYIRDTGLLHQLLGIGTSKGFVDPPTSWRFLGRHGDRAGSGDDAA
jgi:predicted AAA+ superfamily ATPase